MIFRAQNLEKHSRRAAVTRRLCFSFCGRRDPQNGVLSEKPGKLPEKEARIPEENAKMPKN